ILIEPFITPVSYFFYKLFHHEKVSLRKHVLDPNNPWDANIAASNILFSSRNDFLLKHPSLNIEVLMKFSFFDFQLTGGFKNWSLVKNEKVYELFLKADKYLTHIMNVIAFRIFIVLNKK